MPRGRERNSGMGGWVEELGEQIGTQLGRMIADSVRRTLENSIDVGDLARRLGAGNGVGRRGRRGGAKALCSVAGCGNPVLAKGLCRSHYYRARYRAQKAGAGARGKRRRGRRSAESASAASAGA